MQGGSAPSLAALKRAATQLKTHPHPLPPPAPLSFAVGEGPWVQADLESGIWACADRPGTNPKALPQTSTFVTGMVKGFGDVAPYGRWQIKAGNAQQGPLATEFDGPRPAQGVKRAPYYPMKLQGSSALRYRGGASSWPSR